MGRVSLCISTSCLGRGGGDSDKVLSRTKDHARRPYPRDLRACGWAGGETSRELTSSVVSGGRGDTITDSCRSGLTRDPQTPKPSLRSVAPYPSLCSLSHASRVADVKNVQHGLTTLLSPLARFIPSRIPGPARSSCTRPQTKLELPVFARWFHSLFRTLLIAIISQELELRTMKGIVTECKPGLSFPGKSFYELCPRNSLGLVHFHGHRLWSQTISHVSPPPPHVFIDLFIRFVVVAFAMRRFSCVGSKELK